MADIDNEGDPLLLTRLCQEFFTQSAEYTEQDNANRDANLPLPLNSTLPFSPFVKLKYVSEDIYGRPICKLYKFNDNEQESDVHQREQELFFSHLQLKMRLQLISAAASDSTTEQTEAVVVKCHDVSPQILLLCSRIKCKKFETMTYKLAQSSGLSMYYSLATTCENLMQMWKDPDAPCYYTLNCIYGNFTPRIDSRPLRQILGSYFFKDIPKTIKTPDTLGTEKELSADEGDSRPLWSTWLKEDLAVLRNLVPSLNESQLKGVVLGLRSKDVCLIQGPPGTGKTTTLAKLIYFFYNMGLSVLVSSMSNKAVDNIFHAAFKEGVQVSNMKRITYVDPSIISSLNALDTNTSSEMSSPHYRTSSNQMANKKKNGTKNRIGTHGTCDIAHKPVIEKNVPNKKAVDRLPDNYVSFVTCMSILSVNTLHTFLKDKGLLHFDVAIIDEAAQILELVTWVPGTISQRIILAGDHMQLGPFVETNQPELLSRSLFDRIANTLSHDAKHLLTLQYRMHQHIMKWSSETFYCNKLVAHDSVKDRTIMGIMKKCTNFLEPVSYKPIVWIDTSNSNLKWEYKYYTRETQNGYYNPYEAMLVFKILQRLTQCIKAPLCDRLAIITPYRGQLNFITYLLTTDESLEPHTKCVATVDAFQGSEAEIVVFSCVRSNTDQFIGFLNDYSRLNVAMTRAKRQLIIVGDASMFRTNDVIQKLFYNALTLGDVIPSAILLKQLSERVRELMDIIAMGKLDAPNFKDTPEIDLNDYWEVPRHIK